METVASLRAYNISAPTVPRLMLKSSALIQEMLRCRNVVGLELAAKSWRPLPAVTLAAIARHDLGPKHLESNAARPATNTARWPLCCEAPIRHAISAVLRSFEAKLSP